MGWGINCDDDEYIEFLLFQQHAIKKLKSTHPIDEFQIKTKEKLENIDDKIEFNFQKKNITQNNNYNKKRSKIHKKNRI